MRHVRRLLPVFGLLAVVLGAPSAPSDSASLPEITTVGAGGDTCRQWTQAIKEPSARNQYRQWLFGFISGYNWRDPSKQVVPTDSAALISWVDEFCKANPEAPISLAAGNMGRQTAKPPPVATKKR